MGEMLDTVLRIPWGISRVAVETIAAALPGGARLSCEELSDKLEAFLLFQRAAAAPEVHPGLAGHLDPWSRLWVLEGWGYSLGARGGSLRQADPEALIPLSTGFGLALAVGAVEGLQAGHERVALRRFAERCRAALPSGLAGAACETLGLATRTLYPRRAEAIASALEELGEGFEAHFWHGLGRALSFVPTNVLPVGDPSKRALVKAVSEPRGDSGRRNALAGLAWAMTLVGFRHPQVLGRFLHAHAGHIPAPDAFTQGIAAAVLVWVQSSGPGAPLETFLSYASADPRLWDSWVRRPCLQALDLRLPELERNGRWEDLFRVAP